jgi:hypothetical protein
MQNWGLLVVVIGVLVANLPAVMAQWRTDRPGFIKTLWLMGIYALYALYVALGIVLLLGLAPRQPGETRALLLTGVAVGWIFYGALTLMRGAPRCSRVSPQSRSRASRRSTCKCRSGLASPISPLSACPTRPWPKAASGCAAR